MAEEKYNRKNPAVKRILQELKEMQSNPSDDFMSLPLEENIFEWQFAIRGPCDSEFEGGIYHGRIQLPADYPLKPPSFMLLTPSGRWETQTKICLSISNYHPEHWQPSWSVRTALVALIAFMPTKADGALGSLEYNKEERRALAIKSRQSPPKYGNLERQKVINEIHQYMLIKVPPVPELPLPPATDENTNIMGNEALTPAAAENQPDPELDQMRVRVDAAAGPLRVRFSAGVSLSRPQAEEGTQRAAVAVAAPREDRLLGWAALVLAVAISILLVKKFLKSSGVAAGYMD